MKQLFVILSIFLVSSCSLLNNEYQDTNNKKESKEQTLENKIRISSWLGVTGMTFGFVGMLCTLYVTRRYASKKYVRNKVKSIMNEDAEFENRIKMIINHAKKTPTSYSIPKREIEKIIEECIRHNKSVREFLSIYIDKEVHSKKNNSVIMRETIKVNDKEDKNDSIVSTNIFELYAQNSSSMQLSEIQNEFQRGISVYKLILNDEKSDKADVTLCIEKEDVRQRIFVNDTQFLMPICDVNKNAAEPTEIIVIEKGKAEKNVEGWKVTKNVIVEIK
jgi:hypothetical protein